MMVTDRAFRRLKHGMSPLLFDEPLPKGRILTFTNKDTKSELSLRVVSFWKVPGTCNYWTKVEPVEGVRCSS
jgi:hypothetical protein